MSTDSVPATRPPAWHVLLLDLVQQTTGCSLIPTPRKLSDLTGGTHTDGPLATVECRSIADARVLARHLRPGRPADDEPMLVSGVGLCVSIHVQYRGWWLMVGGTDPAPEPAAVAAACLTPDAPAFPYVSGDLGDR